MRGLDFESKFFPYFLRNKRSITMTVFNILRNESGQGLTEYALIIALVAIVAVAALTLLGGQISAIFNDINGDLGGA